MTNGKISHSSYALFDCKVIMLYTSRGKIVNHLDKNYREGLGILSIKWESANVVWTCGYDGCLRRWDLRTIKCVQSWDDPFGATICSFDYDNCCTVITGVQFHGRTVLYDTRKRHFVQVYFKFFALIILF